MNKTGLSKKKKNILIISIVLAVVIMSVAGLSVFMKSNAGKIFQLEVRYKLNFPSDAHLEFKHEYSAMGDGVEYYVISFDEKPAFIDVFYSLNIKEGTQNDEILQKYELLKSSFGMATSENWNFPKNVAAEYLLDWDKEYIWDSKLMTAIYDEVRNYLFICRIMP